eukprot:m.43374 g.43374  ORF g.43374 m.43374 type:complete len:88 (-) comp9972_c0_seq4:1315-1578(-)
MKCVYTLQIECTTLKVGEPCVSTSVVVVFRHRTFWLVTFTSNVFDNILRMHVQKSNLLVRIDSIANNITIFHFIHSIVSDVAASSSC